MTLTKDDADKALMGDSITHAVANAAKDGILLIDTDQKVAFINNTLREWLLWLGIESKHWIGMHDTLVYKTFLEYSKEPRDLNQLFDSVSDNDLISDSIEIEFTNDIYKYVQLYTSPIVRNGSGYLGRLLLFENKTKEKKVDQMKTEFISIASHQLRTPLSAIKGYLSMLIDGDAGEIPDEANEYVEMALEGADRLVNIVEDLLNVSRLEMGRTTPDKEKRSVNEAIKSITQYQLPQIQEKRQKLERNLPDPGVVFNLDSHLLTHIVGNILDNAIKYTPKGGTISLTASIVEKKEKLLHIEVKDSGVGIPKIQQNHIFEKFFRADNVRTEDFTGTGIGLYYVYKLVSSLRGRVWFESAEGKGTTFFIEIPE